MEGSDHSRRAHPADLEEEVGPDTPALGWDESRVSKTDVVTRGELHHVEIWVPDLDRSTESLGWLLETLGYTSLQAWEHGRSWQLNATYIVLEESPALSEHHYDRLRPGLNHLAFHCGSEPACDQIVSDSFRHGWTLLFADLHPHAGGPDHYAGFLSDADGFEVELVADDHPQLPSKTPGS